MNIPYEDLIDVADVAQHWYSGQGDPIYALVSSVYAGHGIDLSTADAALLELERLYSRVESLRGRDPEARANVRELGEAITTLQYAILETRERAKHLPNPINTGKTVMWVLGIGAIATVLYEVFKPKTAAASTTLPPAPAPTPTTPGSSTTGYQFVNVTPGSTGPAYINIGNDFVILAPAGSSGLQAAQVSGSAVQQDQAYSTGLAFVGIAQGQSTLNVTWMDAQNNAQQATINVSVSGVSPASMASPHTLASMPSPHTLASMPSPHISKLHTS